MSFKTKTQNFYGSVRMKAEHQTLKGLKRYKVR